MEWRSWWCIGVRDGVCVRLTFGGGKARGCISLVDLPLMHDAASSPIRGPCHAQTVHDGRIYTLKMYCGDQYPDKVPLGCGSPCRSAPGTPVCMLRGPRLAAARWLHCLADSSISARPGAAGALRHAHQTQLRREQWRGACDAVLSEHLRLITPLMWCDLPLSRSVATSYLPRPR